MSVRFGKVIAVELGALEESGVKQCSSARAPCRGLRDHEMKSER